MILRYDSTAELRSAYIKCHPKWDAAATSRYSGDSWYGGESEAMSVQKALSGDTTLVPTAERLLSSLDTHIETPRRVWTPSPAGAYTVVPDYLSGRPTYMRRMEHEQDEAAPITVLVATTCSAGISAATLEKRGTVILALVMALSRIRPVSLQAIALVDGTHEGETVITNVINTNPLDLATACYILTSAGFARRLTYGLAREKNNFSGGWPRRFVYGKSAPYYDYLKSRLVADPSKCLVIPAAELHDELLSQPLKWIEKQIKHFTNADIEEETT